MSARLVWAPLVTLIATGMLAGCGSGGARHVTRTQTRRRGSSAHISTAPKEPSLGAIPLTIPTPAPTGIAPSPAAVTVIRGWANALRRGDVSGAARYFALPSVMINGPDAEGNAEVTRIDTLAQAEAANESLPCGAKFLSADRRGRYVNALFRLTDRTGPGGAVGCGSGTGLTARTNFVIADGRILEWIRAPDDPGDNPGEGGPTPTVPPNSGAPTPAVPPNSVSTIPSV